MPNRVIKARLALYTVGLFGISLSFSKTHQFDITEVLTWTVIWLPFLAASYYAMAKNSRITEKWGAYAVAGVAILLFLPIFIIRSQDNLLANTPWVMAGIVCTVVVLWLGTHPSFPSGLAKAAE